MFAGPRAAAQNGWAAISGPGVQGQHWGLVVMEGLSLAQLMMGRGQRMTHRREAAATAARNAFQG